MTCVRPTNKVCCCFQRQWDLATNFIQIYIEVCDCLMCCKNFAQFAFFEVCYSCVFFVHVGVTLSVMIDWVVSWRKCVQCIPCYFGCNFGWRKWEIRWIWLVWGVLVGWCVFSIVVYVSVICIWMFSPLLSFSWCLYHVLWLVLKSPSMIQLHCSIIYCMSGVYYENSCVAGGTCKNKIYLRQSCCHWFDLISVGMNLGQESEDWTHRDRHRMQVHAHRDNHSAYLTS